MYQDQALVKVHAVGDGRAPAALYATATTHSMQAPPAYCIQTSVDEWKGVSNSTTPSGMHGGLAQAA